MQIIEQKYHPAEITINYEDVKSNLLEKLEEYKGLVVVEETLQSSKQAQKELAGLRTEIDTFRKEKKKGLEAPIKQFETQCKELIGLVQEAEKPLKEAIQIYDDKKREEKRKIAQQIINEQIEEQGLYGTYATKLTVLDKYMNLTASKKAVKDDVETRALLLKSEQEREEERLRTIQTVIHQENERLQNKLSMNDFSYLIHSMVSTGDIIAEIKKRANKLYESEHLPKPTEEEKTMSIPNEQEMEEPVEQEVVKEDMFSVTYRVVGTYTELRAVSQFLKEKKLPYEVIDQHKLD